LQLVGDDLDSGRPAIISAQHDVSPVDSPFHEVNGCVYLRWTPKFGQVAKRESRSLE